MALKTSLMAFAPTSMPVSLSRIIHHSHSFTRLKKIYHHIYFICIYYFQKKCNKKYRSPCQRKSYDPPKLPLSCLQYSLSNKGLFDQFAMSGGKRNYIDKAERRKIRYI